MLYFGVMIVNDKKCNFLSLHTDSDVAAAEGHFKNKRILIYGVFIYFI